MCRRRASRRRRPGGRAAREQRQRDPDDQHRSAGSALRQRHVPPCGAAPSLPPAAGGRDTSGGSRRVSSSVRDLRAGVATVRRTERRFSKVGVPRTGSVLRLTCATEDDDDFRPHCSRRRDKRPASSGRMFLDRVAQSGSAEAFRYPDGSGWRSLTWEQTRDRVARMAAGLVDLGVEPSTGWRSPAAPGSSGSWPTSAIMCAGAATTTVYPTTSADDVAYILGRLRRRGGVRRERRAGRASCAAPRPAAGARRTVVLFDGTRATATRSSDPGRAGRAGARARLDGRARR